jgi:hypothetical protein
MIKLLPGQRLKAGQELLSKLGTLFRRQRKCLFANVLSVHFLMLAPQEPQHILYLNDTPHCSGIYIAGIRRTRRLDEQQVRFFVRAWAMPHALRNDE